MATAKVYVLYWDPAKTWPGGYAGQVEGFLQDVESANGRSDNVYALARGYAGKGGEPAGQATTYGASYHDTAAVAGSCALLLAGRACILDSAIAAEVGRVSDLLGWSKDLTAMVLVMTPPGTDVCFGSSSAAPCAYRDFCAYHSWTATRQLYATIPYPLGPAPQLDCTGTVSPNRSLVNDAVFDAISHEHIETMTDPYGDGWSAPGTGDEIADLCVSTYGDPLGYTFPSPDYYYNQQIGTGKYYLQGEWGNRAGQCSFKAEAPPLAPTGLAVTTEGGAAFVAFTPSTPTAVSTAYRVSAPGVADVVVTSSPASITGLADGVSYTFQVTTEDAVGVSPPAVAAPIVVGGIPALPPGVAVATPVENGVSVGFNETLDDGGSPVTAYLVTITPGGRVVRGATSPIIVDGLSNGTIYRFSVAAENARGTSRMTPLSDMTTPLGPPPAPVLIVRPAANGLSFTMFTIFQMLAAGSYGIDITVEPGGFSGHWGDLGYYSSSILGLTPGVTYTMSATTTGPYGPSTTTSAQVVPYGLPDAPNLYSVVPGPHQAVVEFPAPTTATPVSSYHVRLQPGAIEAASSTSTVTVGSLVNGQTYTVELWAVNDAGASTVVNGGSVTPIGQPEAPTEPVIEPLLRGAVVSFTPGADGGIATDGYTVTVTPGNITFETTTPSVTVTGLLSGHEYQAVVVAHNRLGPSAPLNAGYFVPISPSNPPIAESLRGGVRSIVVSFRPGYDGGHAIDGYTVMLMPGSITAHGAASPIAVTGLVDGRQYTVSVTAHNSVGDSDPLLAGAVATVARAGATGGLRVRLHGRVATVSFSAPANATAARVTGYRVAATLGKRRVLTVVRVGSTRMTLTRGRWSVTVTAVGPAGDGPASPPVRVVVR